MSLTREFEQSSALFGANAPFVEELFARYSQNPASVPGEWQQFFSSLKDGALLTVVLGVGPERGSSGNPSPIGVMTVTVTRDATTGEYQVTAQ